MESEACKRRHKHHGGKNFTLSGELKARLPNLDRAGLEVLREFGNGKDKSLPFKFSKEAFPITCQDIILKEVIISVFTLEFILCFIVGEKSGGLQHIPSLISIVATSRLLTLKTCLDKRYQHGLEQQQQNHHNAPSRTWAGCNVCHKSNTEVKHYFCRKPTMQLGLRDACQGQGIRLEIVQVATQTPVPPPPPPHPVQVEFLMRLSVPQCTPPPHVFLF